MMKMPKEDDPLPKRLFFLIILIFLIGSSCSKPQNQFVNNSSYFDYLEKENIQELTIESNFEELIATKANEEHQKATLKWMEKDISQRSLDIEISARGETRKQLCAFPPIKIHFDKDSLLSKSFAPIKSLKLVTHCNDDQALVFKEYLAYKLYNELTDKSFRVHLVKINYIDSKKNEKAFSRYGFLLEHKEELAQRLDGKLVKKEEDMLKTVQAEQYRLLTVFQYMIGNTDWNMEKQHNIKLIQTSSCSAPVPIPYDFDFAGFVNAPYAKPHPSMPIKKVTQRYFQWRAKTMEGFENTLDLFQKKRKELEEYCISFELLDINDRLELVEYLDSFFQRLENLLYKEYSVANVFNTAANFSKAQRKA